MASTIKVDNIQNQCGANIINESANTITIGASNTSIAGIGTVNWDTTAKTTGFTAVSGRGYFVNTTSGAITMTMPAGSAGAIVSIQDYNKTFDTNALTVVPASGEKINGGSADGPLGVSTEGQGLTFIYVDSTVGWKTVHENEFISSGNAFIEATGGTITTCGDFKIHSFTGPGTFTVTNVGIPTGSDTVSYMVVAGGGGSGANNSASSISAGGGGAGGYRESKASTDTYTASPLNATSGPTYNLPVSIQAYPITVGGGGPGGPTCQPTSGTSGSPSIFSTITSAGGGFGMGRSDPVKNGGPGGSGGGATGNCSSTGGTGNTPPVSPPQGNPGGSNTDAPTANVYGSAGGGGAGAAANPVSTQPDYGATPGGNGVASSITGSPVTRAGGGGGGGANAAASPLTTTNNGGSGGSGGGGAGGPAPGTAGTAGTANTGGGGGAPGAGLPAGTGRSGANGGSGIVIIRYKFQ